MKSVSCQCLCIIDGVLCFNALASETPFPLSFPLQGSTPRPHRLHLVAILEFSDIAHSSLHFTAFWERRSQSGSNLKSPGPKTSVNTRGGIALNLIPAMRCVIVIRDGTACILSAFDLGVIYILLTTRSRRASERKTGIVNSPCCDSCAALLNFRSGFGHPLTGYYMLFTIGLLKCYWSE